MLYFLFFIFSFTFCAQCASESKDAVFEEAEFIHQAPPLQQFWGELMDQGHVRFDVLHICDFEELFGLLFGMEEEDEDIGNVIDIMLQQLNMERLINHRKDSNEFLMAAVKRGNTGAVRELLAYGERLKPHHWIVLRSFEYAALYNQTHIMIDFLNLRFGDSYILEQQNIDIALTYAQEKGHAESTELIISYPRDQRVPYPRLESKP